MSGATVRKKFTQRNVFYLRASPYVVLQTILYLDYRHVEWMNLNPQILTQVLSILRTRIMPKLRKESDSSGKLSAMSKKERVDVYSDRDFQVAYFFRRMDDRHSVLLKEKSLVFPADPTLAEVKVENEADGNIHAPIPRATATPAPVPRPTQSAPASSAAEGGSSSDQPVQIKDSPEPEAVFSSPNASMASLSGVDDNALFRGGGDDGDRLAMPPPESTPRRRGASQTSDGGGPPRRSKRVRIHEDRDIKPEASADAAEGVEVDQSSAIPATADRAEGDDDTENAAIIITEEDEEKMKPKLQVRYAGFRIFGKLLVLVVEPSKRTLAAHPELFGEKKTAEVRQLSVAPVSMTPGPGSNRAGSVQARFTSLEPTERSSRNASIGRGSTPLFRGATPAYSEASGTPGPSRTSATPTPASPSARQPSLAANEALGVVEGDAADEIDDGPTIGELEGIELATQMLEREEQTMGGNDIDDGD